MADIGAQVRRSEWERERGFKDVSFTRSVTMLRKWRDDPVTMVRDLWKAEPDAWQAEALRAFRTSPRMVMKSCAGPGKSCVLAWIAWNFILTRPYPWIGVTSITGDNLKSGLWTEIARWYQRSDFLRGMFDMTKTFVASKEPGAAATWRMEARTWAKDADANAIGNALRGPHAKYILWLLDESGDYPDSIMPVCENIFAGDPVEAHIVQAGNPTRLGGPLYKACSSARDLWRVIEITADPDDPKRTKRVSVEHARQQIEQYGRDSPWVMINILGQFPPSNLDSLIGMDEVRAAMKRMYREYELAGMPRIIAADVARSGGDQSVIARRHGLQMMPLTKYRNVDGLYGAAVLAREWESFGADACFVDATGGLGYTWIDQLRNLGRAPIPVEFAGAASQKNRYANKRAEMAFEFVEWIKRGGALPEDERLAQALTQTTYFVRGDRMMLEPKDSVKVKLGHSPDEFDAAILLHAAPISPATRRRHHQRSAMPDDYDPFDGMEANVPTAPGPYR